MAWTKGTPSNLQLEVRSFKLAIWKHEHALHAHILPHLCFKWEEQSGLDAQNPIVDDRIVILLPYTLFRVWGTEAAGAMVNGRK